MNEARYVLIRNIVCDWEKKAPFVPSGVSVLGALEYRRSDDKVRCHECGEWFSALSGHLRRTHEMGSRDYKIRHGLLMTAALCNLETSKKLKEHNTRQDMIEARKRGTKKIQSISCPGGNRPSRARRRLKMEHRNMLGLCKAQLLSNIKQIAADLGRTPKTKELGKKFVNAANVLYGTDGKGGMSALIEEAGLESTARPRLAPEILLELLRDFYVRNRRVPTVADFRSGLLPDRTVYTRQFGNVASALMKAGLFEVAQSYGYKRKPMKEAA